MLTLQLLQAFLLSPCEIPMYNIFFQQKQLDAKFRIAEYLRGWWNYYRHAKNSKKWLRSIHGWIMRRLRSILWTQWKNPRTRVRELEKRGVYHNSAVSTGNARKGSWRMSRVKWVIIALPNAYFQRTLGLFLPGRNLLS